MASLVERVPVYDLWHAGRDLGYVIEYGGVFRFGAYRRQGARVFKIGYGATKEEAARLILDACGVSDEDVETDKVKRPRLCTCW